jgi:aryl-alcohol dehydrogenase-like predicted oxidoreductase
MSKIALGTAQFGLPYGISNVNGQVERAEINQIFKQARTAGITMLDTAIAYGNSEENIGATDSEGFEVVTKLPPLTGAETSVSQWVRSQIENSLIKLKRSSVYGLLLHNPADLLGVYGDELYASLALLKEEGLVEKIGISIYTPTELDSLIPTYMPDIVQAPLNVFDRLLETSGWLSRLSKMNVEVHVRSVFLQGLLIQKPNERPANFEKWNQEFVNFDSWIESRHVSPLTACLGHVLSYPEISKVLVGVTSSNELAEIIAATTGESQRGPDNLRSSDLELIQPINWNKR